MTHHYNNSHYMPRLYTTAVVMRAIIWKSGSTNFIRVSYNFIINFSHKDIYRVLLNGFAFAICFSNKELFSILYFISFVCDALDGWFTCKFNQVSTFGAVLDMVTDRKK